MSSGEIYVVIMLISRVSEEGGAEGRPQASADHSHEYQTASELFDLMAKNHPFDADGESFIKLIKIP